MRKFLLIFLLCPFFAHGQNWLWAKTSAGTEDQGATSNATDRYGNIYMAGYSFLNLSTDPTNSIYFGPDAIVNGGGFYDYVVKYNIAGSPVWLKKIPASDLLYVATDPSGNVFLAGSYSGTFTLDAYTLTSADTISTDVFLAKLDSSGNVLWLAAGKGSDGDGGTPSALATDDNGNVILAGVISDSVSFDTLTLKTNNLFIVKYGANGNLKWAKTVGGHPQYDSINYAILFPDQITGVATDRSGNIVLAGEYAEDTFVAGGYELVNRSAGGINSFVIKCDTAGNILWANTAGGATSITGTVSDYTFGTAVDPAGNIYIAGETNSDTLYAGGNQYVNNCGCDEMLFAKYNAAGAFEWLEPSVFPGGSPATNGSFGLGLAAFNCSAVYMIGLATDSVSFGPYTLPSDYYIIKFDTAGVATAATPASNLNYCTVRTVAIDTGGNAYVAGSYYGDCSIGNDTLDLTGASNAFLAKYGMGATTSVNNVKANEEWSLYPNPATNELTISGMDKPAPITIYNVLGQTMYSNASGGQDIKINVSDYPAGVYLVKVKGLVARRFLKD